MTISEYDMESLGIFHSLLCHEPDDKIILDRIKVKTLRHAVFNAKQEILKLRDERSRLYVENDRLREQRNIVRIE
jgi:hypothetical protein